jgi:hypothetical protein
MILVEAVIPWRGGCPNRTSALGWVMSRYMRERPEWSVYIASFEEGEWCKARAVMPAVEAAADDAIVVLADADVWCDGLREAVDAVAGGAPWAIPHSHVYRLSPSGTAAVLAGESWESQPLVQRPYRGVEGGGIVVARRETLLEAPLDERFCGWGQEDTAHAHALTTLVGHPWRGQAPLVHLWHPPQQRESRQRGSARGWALYKRYVAARRDPTRMRALIEEGRACLSPT